MKTKNKTDKKFDAVKMMREIRDQIDRETDGMTFEQLKEYLASSSKEAKNQAGS